MSKCPGPTPGGGDHFLMSHPQVGLECVFTFRFNLGSLGSTLSIVVATPVLGPSSSTLGVPFLTSRPPLGGPSCIFMPSLFFVDAASSFVSITRDIREYELKPLCGKSGKKCSNKKGFVGLYYQESAGKARYHALSGWCVEKSASRVFVSEFWEVW